MATITVRNLSPESIQALKARAKRQGRSMEQEVREILEAQAADRASVVEQITRSWASQKKRPSAKEIESWIDEGRP